VARARRGHRSRAREQAPAAAAGRLPRGRTGCRAAARWALRSRWLWAGTGLALAIWLPNLVWQASHGWPQLELADEIAEEEGGENRAFLLPFQLLVLGIVLVPVAGAGLVALLRDPTLRPWRPLATAYLALLVLLLVIGGKGYYAAPLLLTLLAAGAVVIERRLPSRLLTVALAAAWP
jgi:hypothetical protein